MAAVTNVRVALRCRPLSKKELGEGDTSCFTKEGSSARLKDGEDEVEFAFDYVYDEESTQAEVFRDVGLPVIDAAFAGFNSTVFTYGQTGSGKSWSMTGLIHNPEQRGLLPRINDAIFDRIRAETTEHADRRFLVQCSYFEIYNEIIFDLLDPTPRKEKEKAGGLAIKEHPVLGIHVKGLQQIVAPDAPKIMELMDIGSSNRTVASTAMNAESSRSHSVCLLTVHQKDAMDESKNVYSKLNLVDLAGSERADRTGATGSRLKEGANINKSLSTLGSVINGLVEKARGKKGVFIPYRDSKLTRVLQESLGGNALCTMLATLSPAKANAKETISTLRYAARAKTIKITATKNEEASQISQLNDEIAKLKKLLESKADEISQVGVVESREVSGMDVESLKVAEAKVAKQIFEIEKLRSSTWQDKLKESERHETEVAKMKKAHKDAARRAEGERRRRFDLLRQKQDVELSVKELGLPLKWADAARALRALEARLSDRRSHVGVFCDALAADMRAVLPSSEGEGDRDAAAEAIVKRGAADAVESRLGLLSSELAKISRDEESLQTMANDLVGLVQADYDSAEPEDTPKDERRRKEDARKKDRRRRRPWAA
ncbi:P-loop containing nucleoside triphosphate hydrolase protein [Pelagophyceae sp. CCMP2097]|nr:P-loop containing nucleoside triphosphate hydrolase protein [Pelagophyceae sp. CCMP2097]